MTRHVPLFLSAAILSIFFAVGCGSDSKQPVVVQPVSAASFAFIRGTTPTATQMDVVLRSSPAAERAAVMQRVSETRLSAASLPTGTWTLHTMRNDGTGETAIPNSSALHYASVALSADEKMVVFVADSDTGYPHIFTMSVNGTNLKELTADADGLVDEPMFTPDGAKIFYRAYPNDGTGAQIWAMNLDGSGKTNLTNDPAHCYHSPNISADGKLGVADAHDYSGAENNLYTVDLTTNVVTQVTTGNNPYEFPAISPDKTKIVVSVWDTTGARNIASVSMTGSSLAMLTTTNKEIDANFVGDRLVFQSQRDGNVELYSMKPDGADQKRLTNNNELDLVDNLQD